MAETRVLTGADKGVRCVVNVGWAKGLHGSIVGNWPDSGEFFTVQLDDGSRFASLPGQVDPE